ncbi:hypothetical protein [Yoonia litorea]|uniref:Uncharacterized protein n=1 Tax=Yoonia litorea TaxID=1123755 RepID=A0A1I6L327_9RHOB|nr:hypothetical protein [Yoonia litorea]SFR97913.1 hypothetical protein SAMN05444714_0128 [Yoonia litorea]
MRRFLLVAAFAAAPAFADPLDLIDYEGIFAREAGAVEDVSESRQILRVGDVTILYDRLEANPYTGLDESGEGAVGCFVSILATIESAVLACEVTLPDEQLAIQTDYRTRVLDFYAANVDGADRQTVTDRFEALVASQIATTRPFCANIDLVTDLADRIFAPQSAEEINGMLSVPRLPVSNPCL